MLLPKAPTLRRRVDSTRSIATQHRFVGAEAVRWRKRSRRSGLQQRTTPDQQQQQQGWDEGEEDPVLATYAAAYGIDPRDPPAMIAALARAAAAEREGEYLSEPLYRARMGTAQIMHAMLSGEQGLPRDRCIKITAAICNMITSEIMASFDFKQLQQVFTTATTRYGLDWRSVRTLYVPCLGSIEARPWYVAEVAERPCIVGSEEGGDGPANITRGWVSSRTLWQLAFARALTTLLPNLEGPIVVSDPALTNFDRRVLAECGARSTLTDTHPDSWSEVPGAATSGVLIYAPNCPHAVNAELLESNIPRLPRTAFIGTCLEFYEELDGLRAAQRRRRREEAAAAAAANGSSGSGSSSAEGDGEEDEEEEEEGQKGQRPLPPGCGCGVSLSEAAQEMDGAAREGMTLLADLRRKGWADELALPEFGHIHPPTLRLHVFRSEGVRQ